MCFIICTYQWFTFAVDDAFVIVMGIGWDGVVYVFVVLYVLLVVLCGRGGREGRALLLNCWWVSFEMNQIMARYFLVQWTL